MNGQKTLAQAKEAAERVAVDARRAVNLRRLRGCRGMTGAAIAAAAGICVSFYVEMERGQRAVSIKSIDRLARALSCQPWQVLQELDA